MATFYQSLRRFFGNIGSTGQQDGIQYTEPFSKVYKTSTPDFGIDGALQVSAVWAAVELLTDNIASLPLFVYNREGDAAGNKTLARDTTLWNLLHTNPNRRHTAMEFWQYMVMNYMLRGNAYARKVFNGAGEVIELWPWSADQVEVEVLRDGSVVYKYNYEGKVAIYDERSVFHWRDKGNGIVGMSRLDFMRNSVGIAIDAQNHTQNTFRAGGKRPGVFMIDKLLTAEQRDKIRANYKGLVEGSDDDLLVLEAGAKFEPLSMTPADLQILDTRRFSVEDIARWFGVPSVLINDTAKTTTWGTGISQLIEGFYKFRLRPMLESLEQTIERRVMNPRQRELYAAEFSLEALLRGSAKERLENGSVAVQNGLMTRNEWRQLENLPRMDGGDTLTAQVNLMPVGQLGNTPAMEQRSADLTERLVAGQEKVNTALQTMLQREEKAINVAINPSIEVQTPEVRMDLQIQNDKTTTKKRINMIRDDSGNVLGAETIEE
jgi:HK97 family phage portal protein